MNVTIAFAAPHREEQDRSRCDAQGYGESGGSFRARHNARQTGGAPASGGRKANRKIFARPRNHRDDPTRSARRSFSKSRLVRRLGPVEIETDTDALGVDAVYTHLVSEPALKK